MLDGYTTRSVKRFPWKGSREITLPNWIINLSLIMSGIYVVGLGLEGLTHILGFITRAIEWFHGG
jgi:hypothetical protein